MATQAIPPPPRCRIVPSGVTSPHYVWEVSEDANRAPRSTTGSQVDAKEVTWPVGCGVRGRHLPAYSFINGCIKKPFSQIRGGKPSSTLVQWQSLPTSFLRAVRSEYPAYIVAHPYISWGEGKFGLSRYRFLLQTTSLQRTVNNKNKAGHNSTRGTVSSLLISLWKVLLHTVSLLIQHL